MMPNWKYFNDKHLVVFRVLADGRCESAEANSPEIKAWLKAGFRIDAEDPPAPPPVLDATSQLVALLIDKGVIVAEDFHPDTLAEINVKLEASGEDAIVLTDAVEVKP